MDKARTRQSWRLQRAGPIVHQLTQWTVMAHAPLARRSSCMEHTCACSPWVHRCGWAHFENQICWWDDGIIKGKVLTDTCATIGQGSRRAGEPTTGLHPLLAGSERLRKFHATNHEDAACLCCSQPLSLSPTAHSSDLITLKIHPPTQLFIYLRSRATLRSSSYTPRSFQLSNCSYRNNYTSGGLQTIPGATALRRPLPT